EFIERMKKVRYEIERDGEIIMERMAVSARALIERRVKTEGIGEYSSKKSAPSFYFYGKGNNKGREAAFIKEKSKKINGKPQYTNWAEFRESQGLQSDHVDGTFSGRTWNNVKVLAKGKRGPLKYFATIGNDQEAEEKKMEYLTDRYGDFFK